ncbi:hypothetical protein WKH56_09300 [Priestia sp. SB1]|uniref:Uncharacterized protein n=1 Tax=Priestia aryabhattai TaxID=412384 RepID=A0AAX6NDJ2_PRIAR|nr:hypothetical protein [Priestia aryabhattai]MDU9693857.1 hypothetical protein [Priestia aryabhattai]
MSKVKENKKFKIVEKDNKPNTLKVVWFIDDELGYGVEYSDAEAIIASWSFGDNGIESFILSKKLYGYMVNILSELESKQKLSRKDPNSPFVEVSLPSKLTSATFSINNGKTTKKNNDDVLSVVQLLEEHFGQHPLKNYAEKKKQDIQLVKEKGLWTPLTFVQHSA